jgi:hypothetical protein
MIVERSRTMLRDSALRHIWLAPVFQACVFAAIWWVRGRRRSAKDPALESGYRKLIWRYTIYTIIPWLILGAWLEPPVQPVGLTSTQFAATFATILVIYMIGGLYWVLFAGGAEELAAHPGLPQSPSGSARNIKIQSATIVGLAIAILTLSFALGVLQWSQLAGLF